LVEFDVDPLPDDPGGAVLAAAAQLGLLIATDGPLRKYPGSRHWHLRKTGCAGTLEVTYWPGKSRLWVAYHSNRTGDGWVESMAPEFVRLLSP
jgi:hypothetical protein